MKETVKQKSQIMLRLNEIRTEAKEEMSEIRAAGYPNSYAAGYEQGRIDLIDDLTAFLREETIF